MPRFILQAKIKGTYVNKKPGQATVLSIEEEKELVQWIVTSCKRGFSITKVQLLESVKVICLKLEKRNTFTNNTPERSWYKDFIRRNPEVVS